MICRIPIAHFDGGELSAGAIDNSLRFSMSFMSDIHLTPTQLSRKRLIQIGIPKEKVHFVGSTGVENILSMELKDKEELKEALKKYNAIGKEIDLNSNYALLIFHPETLLKTSIPDQVHEVQEAVKASIKKHNINYIIIGSNADSGGRNINELMKEFASKNSKNVSYIVNLKTEDYLPLLKNAKFLLGNSSSAIIESPTLRTISINIGDRQKQREQTDYTLNCRIDRNEMLEKIDKALNDEEYKEALSKVISPYEKPNTALNSVDIILETLKKGIDIQKHFADLDFEV